MEDRKNTNRGGAARRWQFATASALFFISGAAGLGFQAVWAKMFSAGVGHEYPAVLGVVTAFMAGMALGGFAFSRLPEGLRRSSKAYGVLEISIGVWGAASAFILPRFNEVILLYLGPEPSFAKYSISVFATTLLALLPATAAMGATLPAMRIFSGSLSATKSIGFLYGLNTLGAVAGVAASAFLLMPRAGLRNTLFLLAAGNLATGTIALLLPKTPQSETTRSPGAPSTGSFLPLFATGFLSIGFEIVAVRALGHILENTIYTFAVVLGIFLLGISLGGFLYHRFQPRFGNFARGFAAMCLSILWGGIILRVARPIYANLRETLPDTLPAIAFAEAALGALILLPATISMGMLFAYLAEQAEKKGRHLGWSVGINTLGGAVAPPVFGLILPGMIGVRGSFLLIALGYALLMPKMSGRAILAAAVLLGSMAIPGGKQLVSTAPDESVIWFAEGPMGSVAVVENKAGERVLKANSRFQMGGTAARIAEERQALIPLALANDPKRALFLGLGTGITLSAAAGIPGIQAEAVELAPLIAEASALFTSNNLTGKIRVADARRYLVASTNHYDVIVGDLFHPSQDGAGLLYSKEHFEAVSKKLTKDGIFCQWLPLHQLDIELVKIITATFLEVFPRSEAWLLRLNADTPVIGLVHRSKSGDAARLLEARMEDSQAAELLRKAGLADSVRLFGLFVADAAQLSEFSRGAPINTDNEPEILFRAPVFSYKKQDNPAVRVLDFLRAFDSTTALGHFSKDKTFVERTADYIKARNLYFQGLSDQTQGNQEKAVTAFIESARISADFTSGYAQCISLAAALWKENRPAARGILKLLDEAQPSRPVARQLLEKLEQQPE